MFVGDIYAEFNKGMFDKIIIKWAPLVKKEIFETDFQKKSNKD